jgi:hypothetical protein
VFGGAAVALGASVVTWVVAQTILTSLAAYGEKLEALVSLVPCCSSRRSRSGRAR